MSEERGVERMQAEREFLENRYGGGERGEVEPHSLDHQDDEKVDYVQRPFGGAERIRGRSDINPETEGKPAVDKGWRTMLRC